MRLEVCCSQDFFSQKRETKPESRILSHLPKNKSNTTVLHSTSQPKQKPQKHSIPRQVKETPPNSTPLNKLTKKNNHLKSYKTSTPVSILPSKALAHLSLLHQILFSFSYPGIPNYNFVLTNSQSQLSKLNSKSSFSFSLFHTTA